MKLSWATVDLTQTGWRVGHGFWKGARVRGAVFRDGWVLGFQAVTDGTANSSTCVVIS